MSMLRSSSVSLAKCAERLLAARELCPPLASVGSVARRALLYVPGADQRKIVKAAALTPRADCVVLDCEDGVALASKSDARQTIAAVLNGTGAWSQSVYETLSRRDLCVRVNSVEAAGGGGGGGEQQLCPADLSAVLTAARLPHTLMVPKIESVEQVDWLWSEVARLLASRSSPAAAPLRVLLFCESAGSLLQLEQLSAAACTRSAEQLELSAAAAPSSRPPAAVMEGWVFGSDDYCADVGASRSADSTEVLCARQRVLTVARALRLQAIDMVFVDYADADGLRRQAEQGADWGFTGKQVIHPSQVGVVQSAFSPSERQLQWARRVTDEFGRHQQQGRGAFALDGRMIDLPLVQQARNILASHQASSDQ